MILGVVVISVVIFIIFLKPTISTSRHSDKLKVSNPLINDNQQD